ncbi:thioredoxin reductase [Alkalibacillus filiformis]|uniref:Thioredoxin reductase n=1 Tax=Alkalibacillus filiformis TaxID=200990 RepID=A0ABU0DUS4_9BACI|nr:FAD/NAD(P)-binding protein [Alkalibacillus filiformis]MDQ0352089.1 thioredoxin reductase [Alkalibacillus filiformis]
MYKWIIIGGGVQGCTIATHLIRQKKVDANQLLIIDSYEKPMHRWQELTSKIGMPFLRSPSVHQIDTNPFSLQHYAKKYNDKSFFGKYKRPALELFNQHSQYVLNSCSILDCWHRGNVCDVKKEGSSWCVKTNNGEVFKSTNLVIAVGSTHDLHIPDWAKGFENVHHVFSSSVTNFSELSSPVVVVGGGISAAHSVIKLANLFPGKVTLLKRKPFKIHLFDSDPGWLGPKYLNSFNKEKELTKRREIITNARHKGSIPRDLYFTLLSLERKGQISIVTDQVKSLSCKDDQKVNLLLESNPTVEASSVLLATGFKQGLPNQSWLSRLIIEENLPCAQCGFPITNQLEWCSHLYVAGSLAELEVGPIAKNIAGARKAAKLITQSK